MDTISSGPVGRPRFPWWEKLILLVLCAAVALGMWFFERIHGR